MNAAADACFVGIDLGTSGCRVVAIDANADICAEAREPLPPSRRSADGGSEQDPASWWHAVTSSLTRVIDETRGAIKAICVDGTSSTLLLCDAAGEPCTPALMYDDRRAAAEATALSHIVPGDSAAQGPTSALAKLLYLQRSPAAGHAAHALHQADWIAARLTGRYGFSDENNSLKLGYDPVARCWPTWMAAAGALPRLLPQVLPVGRVIGNVSALIATSFGLPADTRVVSGTTDGNAAALASAISLPGEAVTSLGSTLVLKLISTSPVTAKEFGIYSHRLGDVWLTGGASNSGGSVLRQYFTDEQLAQLSAQIDPLRDSGLDYYPLPTMGERFPVADPNKAPCLTPRPDDPARFLHGILEGIARIEAAGYRRLAELGAPYPTRVLSAGGGAVNDTWRRIRERLLGVPVARAPHDEAAYGSALLARKGLNDAAIPPF